jgi:outer membrane biosynthesis protein TonB
MEVYTGSIVPPRFAVAPGIGPRTCGVIVVWSREGERRPRKRTSTVSPASELAKLVDDRQIFTAAQVDVTARQDSAKPLRPVYPDVLHDAQISGSVMAEFIVSPLGEVDLDRVSIVFATHPLFVDAVRRALETAVYVPAIRGGYPVFQVVQHEFRFVPDSSRRRRG